MRRIANRIRRLALHLFYDCVASRLPGSTHRFFGGVSCAIRVALCRRLFAACGDGVNIETGVSFGDGRNIRIGDCSDLGVNAEIHGELTIGNHVIMGPHVIVWTANHVFDRTDVPILRQGQTPSRPVRIGDDVWIGTRVILLPGVTIGRGAVIGAGAVVSRDVPEWAVAVGNPARVVRYRNRTESPVEEPCPTAR